MWEHISGRVGGDVEMPGTRRTTIRAGGRSHQAPRVCPRCCTVHPVSLPRAASTAMMALSISPRPSPEITTMRLSPSANAVVTALAFGLAAMAPMAAQQATQPEPAVARLVAEPSRINLKVGDSVAFKVTAYDAKGAVLP